MHGTVPHLARLTAGGQGLPVRGTVPLMCPWPAVCLIERMQSTSPYRGRLSKGLRPAPRALLRVVAAPPRPPRAAPPELPSQLGPLYLSPKGRGGAPLTGARIRYPAGP